MSWLTNIAGNVIRNIVFTESPPKAVLEVKLDQYINRGIHCREDCLVLYGPRDKKKDKYEIILNRHISESMDRAYSLYRGETIEDAETQFIIFRDKIPVLMQLSKEFCNVAKIQKLCDVATEHPTWTLAHIAAYLSLYDAFQNDAVNRHLNSSDLETGVSPLQVAIQTQNIRMVQMLIESKSSLEHLDHQGKTVYHYAANSTKEIINALGPSLPGTLNSQDCNGHTPLHVACLKDKPECVKALLMIGADVNICSEGPILGPGYVGDVLHNRPNALQVEDMKFGGNPIHWASSRNVINALIEKNCNINVLNFDNRTALHIMVMRKRLDCVVALLSHMANINVPDKDGNTPLHFAANIGYKPIVQMLLGFGADMNAVNNHGETPRHLVTLNEEGEKVLYLLHAVGAQRCSENVSGCHPGCRYGDKFDGVAPPETPSAVPRTALDQMLYVASMEKMANKARRNKKGGRLLCLDGGGIRGLVLIQTLLEIESVLGKPVVHCFDWIAGTSTGGILALGLAAGKNLKELQALYFRIKEEAFVGKRPYSSEPLEGVLQQSLGSNTTMSDIESPKLIIMGVLADRKPVDLHIFRNYSSPSEILKVPLTSNKFKPTLPPEEQLLWKAARATGAAPSYFRAFGRFLDGGLIANNPTLDAMTEIHERNLALEATEQAHKATPLSLVVSLGTGAIPVSPLTDIDVFRPEGLWDTAKLALGVSTLGHLLVDQATMSDGRVVDRARTWCSMIGVPYYRFNPQLNLEIAMDEKNDIVLADMIWVAKAFMHANRDQIKELVAIMDSIDK